MTDAHLQDEDLELYILGILPASKLDAVEEHLLGCHRCIARAEELEAYIRAARRMTERKPN